MKKLLIWLFAAISVSGCKNESQHPENQKMIIREVTEEEENIRVTCGLIKSENKILDSMKKENILSGYYNGFILKSNNESLEPIIQHKVADNQADGYVNYILVFRKTGIDIKKNSLCFHLYPKEEFCKKLEL